MKNENVKRHMDLSAKIFDMGMALSKEGERKKDYMITSAGNIITLISGLLYDEDDMHLFGELCSMFSAKKLVDSQSELGPLINLGDDELHNMITRLRDNLNDFDDEDVEDNEIGDDEIE